VPFPGEGAYFHLDPTDSGGCHKGGAHGVMNAHLSLGEGHVHGAMDVTVEDGNPPNGISQSYFRPVSALLGIQWDLWKFTNHHTVCLLVEQVSLVALASVFILLQQIVIASRNERSIYGCE
jgi:hypothetical protein